jgi:nucleotide-binding universal stress UspA family protein
MVMSVAEHILLATDFSEAADEAVDKARELARTLAARLTVIHVFGHPPAAPEAYVDQERMLCSADLEREAKEQLESLKNQRLADLPVELVSCEHASPALAVCDYADHHNVDLIVIGSHGRTGLSRLLIGSVAEKTARHANCPVLIVPHGKGPKPAQPN